MSFPRSLKIGITIGLHAAEESLWVNGIKQNALYLAKLFKCSPLKHQIRLLNTTEVAITSQLPWSLEEFPTGHFDEACDGLDVIIELGGQISPIQTARIKAQGTKLVSYCCGPEYVQSIEAMIFRRPLWDNIYINLDYDELWIIPQIWDLNRGFLKAFRRCPAKRVPFVWDPMALVGVAGTLPDQGEYRPRNAPKRLTVIEPNIDVLKFCLYPTLIAEMAFRQIGSNIEYLHVTNADHLARAGGEFANLMRQLDIVQAGKASFIGRVRTPDFLHGFTDVVISHQWGLPLNYFYLECCWQGYPLVHNAALISDLGYYYSDHDLDQGAVRLVEAVCDHDTQWEAYRLRQRVLIERYLATNQTLVREYDSLLEGLFFGNNGFG